jgi:hypothetical protein
MNFFGETDTVMASPNWKPSLAAKVAPENEEFGKSQGEKFLKIGGADGIRIHQLIGNKGVLRCSPAF